MVQSMTGFGKAEIEFSNKKIVIEIKSLNSKQLDTNLRIPNTYREKDIEIRNLLSQSAERGKVELSIITDTSDKTTNVINQTVVKNYYEEIKKITEELHVDVPEHWLSTVLRLPDAIKTDTSELDEKEWKVILQGIKKALASLNEFRAQEGLMLENVFKTKIGNIEELFKEIEIYEPERIEHIKTRIQESFLKSETVRQYDENRFEQELIFYIDRLDINEEKSRLSNHLKYFIETLENERNQGRKLGFIAQEIGREINTLGSKSNHAAMQKIVVQMKDELEQIKEQILNVL
jgi:uncharacterized protein (TIGR00255 family)